MCLLTWQKGIKNKDGLQMVKQFLREIILDHLGVPSTITRVLVSRRWKQSGNHFALSRLMYGYLAVSSSQIILPITSLVKQQWPQA